MWRTQRWRRWWTSERRSMVGFVLGMGGFAGTSTLAAHEGPAGQWSVVSGQWCAAGPAGAATFCTSLEVDCQPGQDPGREGPGHVRYLYSLQGSSTVAHCSAVRRPTVPEPTGGTTRGVAGKENKMENKETACLVGRGAARVS